MPAPVYYGIFMVKRDNFELNVTLVKFLYLKSLNKSFLNEKYKGCYGLPLWTFRLIAASNHFMVSNMGSDVVIDFHAIFRKFSLLGGQRFRISSAHVIYHCEAEKLWILGVLQKWYAFRFNFSANLPE